MAKNLIILGSARSSGDTARVVDYMVNTGSFDKIDLNDYEITPYDYEHENRNDDFLTLIQSLIKNYNTIIFATPVYWYSMSSVLKVFFDRLSDLLTIEKELGRKLRGKSMAAISCSVGDNLGEDFWHPFINTARYLGMNYKGHVHIILDRGTITMAGKKHIKKFINQIEK